MAVSSTAPHGADDNEDSRMIINQKKKKDHAGRESRQAESAAGGSEMQLNEFVIAYEPSTQVAFSLFGGGGAFDQLVNHQSISSSLVDRTYGPASPGRADVDLPAADGATSGFCRQRLGRETRGLAVLAGAVGLGWAGLRCSPQLTGARAAATGRATSGATQPSQPHIPKIIIMGRSTCARRRYEVSCGVIPACGQYPVTAPSAMSLLLAAKLLVHCQIPTAL